MQYMTEPSNLAGVVVLEPQVFGDERGFFYESFSDEAFREATGLDPRFIQDNHSRSRQGVLRGLHYQLPPNGQGKLVRCTRGAIWDVAVDVMVGSSEQRSWFGTVLSEENHKQMWIPAGYAHGFLVVSEVAEVQYKTTSAYAPQSEASVRWSDPSLGIEWPNDVEIVLSDKDRNAPLYEDAAMMDFGE